MNCIDKKDAFSDNAKMLPAQFFSQGSPQTSNDSRDTYNLSGKSIYVSKFEN